MKHKSTPNSLSNPNEETERLYFALQAAGIGTWSLDPLSKEVAWDDRCRELYGFADEAYIPYDQILKCIHPDDRELVMNAVARALDPVQGAPYEIQFRTIGAADKKLRWLYCRGKAYFNEENIAYRFSGTAQDITEVVLSREQIAAAEQRAQMALDGAKAGAFSILLDSNGIEYSKSFAHILTGDENSRLDWADFIKHIHPDDRKLRKAAYDAAETTGRLDYEARVVWNDGSIHWMRAAGSYLMDTSGKPYLFNGIIHDITAEVAGRHQEARHNALIAASHDWMGIAKITGHCEFINSSGRALLGIDETEQASNLFDLCTPLSEGILRRKAIPALLETGSWEGRIDFRHLKKKKISIPVYLKATLQRDSKEQPDSMVIAGRDLRSEEAALHALRENEALFRNVTNSSPVGLWLSDEEGALTYLNKTLIDWTGMPYKDLLGAGWAYAIIDEDRPGSIETFRAAISKRGHYDVLFRIKTVTGAIVWCRAAGDPYYRADGSYAGYAGSCMDIDEQMAATLAFQESEKRFRSIVEQAPMAIGLLRGKEMVVEVANERILEIWGKDHTVIGLPVIEALPEIEGQLFTGLLKKVYETGKPYYGSGTLATLARNGRLEDVYLDFTYTPWRGNDGTIIGIMALATDVTAQVLARKKIEESEARFRALIAAAPTAIALFVGRDLIIENPNQTFIEMCGKDASIIGKPLREGMPELLDQPFLQILDDVFTSGIAFQTQGTQVNVMKNGEIVPGFYDFSYTPLRNADNEVYAILEVAIDVTDQVRSNTRIAAAESALRDAIELAELATWTMDFKTGRLSYSNRLMNWFGFSEGESIYSAHYNPIHEHFREELEKAMELAKLPEGGGFFNIEVTIVEYKTGSERIIHAQGRTVFDEDGNPLRLSGTAQDVTAQRQIQLELERQVQERTEELQTVNEELNATNEELYESNNQLTHSNEELAQYAYVASHDLQEPLRKIRMFSGMLGKAELSDHNRDLVQKINLSSERMALLIRDLLDFSRLLKTDSLMRPVDLTAVVAAVVDDFELSVQEKKAKIVIGKLPVIEAVSLQMNQLFYNLLGNALKFTNPGVAPYITVDASTISMDEVERYIAKPLLFSNYYRIIFTDNGIGFEVKYSEQIFEVFKRLHGKELYPGSGIGLALCRRIAGNHNGHLYAVSEPGKGTSFHILLPDRQHNQQPTLPGSFTWDNEQNTH